MYQPMIVKFTEELKLVQKRWHEADRQTQDVIYYQEFAPKFAPLFSELPLCMVVKVKRSVSYEIAGRR